MGVGIQSANLISPATPSVTIGTTKNTATSISGNATNQTTTLGTVTAGKTWRVVGCALSIYHSSWAGGEAYIAVDGVKIFSISGASGAGIYGNNANSQTWAYAACPVAASTKVITLVSPSASCIASGQVQYIEE